MPKRDLHDWRYVRGQWLLFDGAGTVIAEVFRTRRDIFTGWGWRFRGVDDFDIYMDARDGKARCGHVVAEHQRQLQPGVTEAPAEQFEALFK